MSDIMSGAAGGAAVGSVVPGVGTAIGAGVGAIGGGIMDWIGQNNANNLNWDEFTSNQNFQQRNINNAYAWQQHFTDQQQNFGAATLMEQERYNTQMAGSAHQREMADLRAAGLNPMLSGTGGQGAQSPGVSAPSIGNNSPGGIGGGTGPAMQNAFSGLGTGLQSAMGSALSAVKLSQDIKNSNADILLKNAQTLGTAANAQQATANAKQIEQQSNILSYQTPSKYAQADRDQQQARMDQQWMATERVLNAVKQGSGIANDASSAISRFLPQIGLKNMLNNAMIGASKGKGVLVP